MPPGCARRSTGSQRSSRTVSGEGHLDTVAGDAAERLYTQLGYERVGVIPGYALYPDGRPCDTTVFFKNI